jgi:hypothetical protein
VCSSLVFLQHKYMSPNDDSHTEGLSLNVYYFSGIARMKASSLSKGYDPLYSSSPLAFIVGFS